MVLRIAQRQFIDKGQCIAHHVDKGLDAECLDFEEAAHAEDSNRHERLQHLDEGDRQKHVC